MFKLQNAIANILTGSIIIGALTACGFMFSEQAKASNCLALNIYHEARGEPIMGQIAVAHVTLNRVEDTRWPDNVCDVVYQPKQFSWTHTIKNQTPKSGESWMLAKSLAKDIMRGIDEDNTAGAVYYHADYVNPIWNRELTQTAKIGVHVFYKD